MEKLQFIIIISIQNLKIILVKIKLIICHINKIYLI